MKYKDKIIKEIKEIGKGIIGATMVRKIDNTSTLTAKGISSLFRAWADIVIPELIEMPDKFSFDALLEDEVMSPEIVEQREKNEITLDDIKDMLLLASSEISSKYPNLQPLSEIKVKWLNEWFDNEDKGAMTTPEPPTKNDAPDFSHMKSHTPTNPFDMSTLYNFLIDEGVIENIDEKFFKDCITHAHMNVLWEVSGGLRKHNQMRCVFNLLHTHHYKKDWIKCVAKNLDTTPKKIYNPTRESLGDFEKRLREII